MTNRTSRDAHRAAMNCAAQGFMAQWGKNPDAAIPHFAAALELEMEAIALLPEPIEPTWSILHRSAGWMAVHSRQFPQAEALAAAGLANCPPADIAAELHDLIRQMPRYAKRQTPPESDQTGPGVKA